MNEDLVTFSLPLELGYRLTKVYMDSAVINQYIVHLEVCILTLLLTAELYKGILQGLPRFLILQSGENVVI